MIKDTMFDNDYYALFVEQGSGKMAINALNALPTHREESQRTQGVGSVGWIPCSERLPKQGQEVICQCRASIIKILKLNANGDWYQDARHCYMSGFVIAWMPLPEPWKGENHETD